MFHVSNIFRTISLVMLEKGEEQVIIVSLTVGMKLRGIDFARVRHDVDGGLITKIFKTGEIKQGSYLGSGIVTHWTSSSLSHSMDCFVHHLVRGTCGQAQLRLNGCITDPET